MDFLLDCRDGNKDLIFLFLRLGDVAVGLPAHFPVPPPASTARERALTSVHRGAREERGSLLSIGGGARRLNAWSCRSGRDRNIALILVCSGRLKKWQKILCVHLGPSIVG